MSALIDFAITFLKAYAIYNFVLIGICIVIIVVVLVKLYGNKKSKRSSRRKR